MTDITSEEIIEILDKKISIRYYSYGIAGGISGKTEAAKAIIDKIKEKEKPKPLKIGEQWIGDKQ